MREVREELALLEATEELGLRREGLHLVGEPRLLGLVGTAAVLPQNGFGIV